MIATLRVGFFTLVCVLFGTEAASALSIKKKDLVGAWTYVDSYLEFPDGRRAEQFSKTPRGIFILLANGWYSHIILRPDLPRVSSGIMLQATPEEARQIAIGSLSHYGTYTVDEQAGTFSAHVKYSDFPNLNGLTQTRKVLALSKCELRYINDVTNAGPGVIVRARLRNVECMDK